MTEGQIRYQTLMENQRHNLAMEKLGAIDTKTKQRQQDLAEARWPVEKWALEQDVDSRGWTAAGTYVGNIGSAVKNIGGFLFGDVFKAATAGLIG